MQYIVMIRPAKKIIILVLFIVICVTKKLRISFAVKVLLF